MRFLSREQFLALLKLDEPNYDAMQRKGQAALAFGAPLPGAPGRYHDLDLVAMALVLGMAPTVPRETAATIVLGFFNQWVAAVARAEVDPGTDYFFALGLMGGDVAERRQDEIHITHGTRDAIMADLPGARSIMAMNVTDILARLRANARDLDIDLSQPFFFSPDHPRFSQIIDEFKQMRHEQIARFRRARKKFRAHQLRMRQQQITPAPRIAADADRAGAGANA